jgi:guanylate kinase
MPAAERRLVLLTGPSCVGKSPLKRALARHRPDLYATLREVVLYNSRDPRPEEEDGVDYHFRRREEIEALRENDDYVVAEVRGDLQAVEIPAVEALRAEGTPFYEGNPTVAGILQNHPKLESIPKIGLFVSPLSAEEIRALGAPELHADPEAVVADVMRRKLLRRTRAKKGILSAPDLEEVERRCTSAYDELREAERFDWILANHDGEDHENWTAFPRPLGDAGRALDALTDLLEGRDPRGAHRPPLL